VFLGPDGTVAGMTRTPMTRTDLERILSAAASGQAIPSVAAAPSPTPIAGDPSLAPSSVCGLEPGTCLPVGSRMPAWSLPLMHGGSTGSADLLGRPAVVVSWSARCLGRCPEDSLQWLRDLAVAIEEYRGRASFVIMSDGEIRPGDTEKAFGDAGVDIPLVFDWDGSLRERFGWMTGAAVYGADGRLVEDWQSESVAGIRAILEPLVASPSPSGAP
jgi:peroxiredoxin